MLTAVDLHRRNISLTAHVLIALTETADKLQGDVKRFSNTARHRAVKYLERYLEKVTMMMNKLMIIKMMAALEYNVMVSPAPSLIRLTKSFPPT